MPMLRPVMLFMILAVFAPIAAAQQPAPTPQELCDAAEPRELTSMQFEQAEYVLEPDVDYRAIFCTSAGAIYLDLYEALTPTTVNNLVFLAQQGYYDSTSFHRVIPDFMAQGGDPTATGRGGPGYQFKDEPVGFLTFDQPGKLAMANAGPGTNGSQFFITTAPSPHLNYKHTIFGDVLAGQGVVESIRERDPSAATEPGETLFTVLIITDALVAENELMNPAEPAAPEAVTAAFDAFAAGLPPALPLDGELSGYFSVEALAASAVAEDLQADFARFAAEYGHQYRQRMRIVNGDCDGSIYFSSLGFWVDVYADAAAARAAAQSDFMQRWLGSEGYARDAADPALYQLDAATCNGEAGARLLSLSPRGRFLLAVDVLVGRSILNQASASAILDSLFLQIEAGLASIFLAEIR